MSLSASAHLTESSAPIQHRIGTSSCDVRYFRFILICLGKSILLLSTDHSVEDLSDEKRYVHENASFLNLDFLVSSVQFSVNKNGGPK